MINGKYQSVIKISILLLIALLPISVRAIPSLNMTANKTVIPAGLPTYIEFNVTNPCGPYLNETCPNPNATVSLDRFGIGYGNYSNPSGRTNSSGIVTLRVNPWYVGNATATASSPGYLNKSLIISSISTPISITGYINQGVEGGCYILDSDNGNPYELFNLNPIPPMGSRLYVTGIVEEGQASYCMQGIILTVLSVVPLSESQIQIGFISGTVMDNVTMSWIANATVTATNANTSNSTKTNESGFYSLQIPEGTYTLNVTKEPEYYPNTSVIVVAPNTTVIQDIELAQKPTGTISGVVTNL